MAAAALVGLVACLGDPAPTVAPTASPTSTPAPTAIPTEKPIAPLPSTAPPPIPPEAARLPAPVQAPPVPVVEATALIPGASTSLSPGEIAVVDPAATFRVVLRGTFPEARLSLLDPGDAMVPSAGAREAAAATTLTLQPAAPLRPATHYRLRVDGATVREVRATDGTLHAPVELPVLAAGAPEPEPKRPRAKKPRR